MLPALEALVLSMLLLFLYLLLLCLLLLKDRGLMLGILYFLRLPNTDVFVL